MYFLQDAGYGEKNILTIEEDNDDDSQVKMDDEVRINTCYGDSGLIILK